MSSYDQQLLEQWVVRRDAEAFREIAHRYAGLVYSTCRRILGNPSDAEEVAQECFEALAAAGQRPGNYLVPWLHRVATNKSLNRIRSEKSRHRCEESYPRTDTDGVATVVQRDLYAAIDEAIVRLPDELRIPLVAHFLDDRTQESIAAELGISRQTVTYRIGKGIETIRKRVKVNAVAFSATTLAEMLKPASQVPPSLAGMIGKLALAGPITPFAAVTSFSAAKALIAAVVIVGVAGLVSFQFLSPAKRLAAATPTPPPAVQVAAAAVSTPPSEAKPAATQPAATSADAEPSGETASAAAPATAPNPQFRPHSCLDEGFVNGECVFSARQFILSRTVRRSEFPDGRIVIFDLGVPSDLTLLPEQKLAIKCTYREDRPASHEMPEEIFERLAARATKEPMGTKNFEGKECTGFRVKIPPYVDMTLWRDTQTNMPIRLETLQSNGRLVVESEFSYDFDMDPARFSMTPPEGYEYKEKTVYRSWWRSQLQRVWEML